MQGKNYYDVLGLKYNCSQEEVRIAYRLLAQKLHPDHNVGSSYFNDLFKLINEAYETLNSPAKRRNYDSQFNFSGNNNSNTNNNNKNTANERREPRKITRASIKEMFLFCFAFIVLVFVMFELYFPFFYTLVDNTKGIYPHYAYAGGTGINEAFMQISDAKGKILTMLLINLVFIFSLSQVFSRSGETLEQFLENWSKHTKTARVVFITQFMVIIQCIILLALSLFFGIDRIHVYDLIILIIFQSFLLYSGRMHLW